MTSSDDFLCFRCAWFEPAFHQGSELADVCFTSFRLRLKCPAFKKRKD